MNDRKGGRLYSLAEGSLIVGGLMRLADYLHSKLGESVVGSAFSSYDAGAGRYSERTGVISSRLSGVSRAVRQFFMKGVSGSFLIRALNSFCSAALAMPMKGIAVGGMSAGAYITIIWLLKKYTMSREAGPGDLAVGAALFLASLILLSSKKTLDQAISGSLLADLILFRLLGLGGALSSGAADREKRPESSRSAYAVAFAVGTVLGIATFFVSPLTALTVFVGLIILRVIAAVPESGLVMMLLCLPFVPTMGLVALNSWCFVCWAVKLACGKRTIKTEPLDMWVLVFAVLYAMGGLVSAGGAASLRHSAVFCDYLLGYFMTVNLIRTGEWVKRCAAAACIGGAAVSLYGIYQYLFGLTETTWQDTEMFENISGRVVSTFGNPNVLAEYLLLIIPLTASLVFVSKNMTGKAACLACLAAGAGCLVLTFSRGAWLGFILAALIYLIILNHRTLLAVFAGLFVVPFLPFLLPEQIVSRFASIGNLADTSTSYRVNIWRGVIKIARDFFFSGIGTGNEAFVKVYPSYSLAGIESAPHSHQLFLQILIECGIFGLIAFIIAMVSFSRANFSFYRHHAGRRTGKRYLSAAGFCGVIAVLAQGMTDYVWYNYRIFLMFWLVVGLTSAARRAGISDNPIRAVKKLEDCSPDNAAIDIMVS